MNSRLKLLLFVGLGLALVTYFVFRNKDSIKHEPESVFKLHLLAEPHSLDPLSFDSLSGNYLAHNLFRGLVRLSPSGQLQDAGGSCHFETDLLVRCQIKEDHLYSDGAGVKASDYVYTFKKTLSKNNPHPANEGLLKIKGARQILKGELEPTSLSVKANGQTLIMELEEPDSDFIHRLAHPNFVPQRREGPIFTGPYELKTWNKGRFIEIKANKHFAPRSAMHRPLVRFYFVQNDATASRMFSSGTLNFLRRVPAALLKVYENHPGLFQTKVWRFDYYGFNGKDFHKNPKFMLTLNQSLNYVDLQDLFKSKGRPGCPGLPERFYGGTLCQKYVPDLTLPASVKPHSINGPTIYYSKINGEDARKWAEWTQHQWQKSLGIDFEIVGLEAGTYRTTLTQGANAYFRKSLPLTRPTCLAALEVFVTGHSDNFIGFDSKEYNELARALSNSTQNSERTRLCRKGLELLLNSGRLTPAGPMEFTMVSDGAYEGFRLNPMGELDLSKLRPSLSKAR